MLLNQALEMTYTEQGGKEVSSSSKQIRRMHKEAFWSEVN
jgi:hypothetical protein